jgi:ornithine cyclodeaminase
VHTEGIWLRFLSGPDIDSLGISRAEIIHWREAQAGRFGALRHHVDAGILNERSLHAELGQVLAGDRPGRESPDERILLWHRGLSILDIAVAQLILERAVAAEAGTMLRHH